MCETRQGAKEGFAGREEKARLAKQAIHQHKKGPSPKGGGLSTNISSSSSSMELGEEGKKNSGININTNTKIPNT